MYGISNSQQQGGGGGSAASYTKIESKIAKTAWTDNTPSWIGQNALTWTLNGDSYYIQGGTEDLGLVGGGSYTTVVTIDGTDYEQSRSEVMFAGDGMTAYLAYFNGYTVFMQIADHCSGLNENGSPVPGNGYLVMVMVEGTPSSVIIKSCSAVSGSIEAIINNSAIKTNSAVTMYVDYDGKMSALKKIDGSLTVSISTMPTVDISYAIEIVDTNIEGLFEVINNNFPSIPEIPASLPQTVYGWYGNFISSSSWTKGTYTNGSDYYYADFNLKKKITIANMSILCRVNYAGSIEIEMENASADGTVTMRVTVDKLPTQGLYIYYRLEEVSDRVDYSTDITVINEFSGFITDKPDHLYLTDTATGTLYEVTVANGTISLVAQAST